MYGVTSDRHRQPLATMHVHLRTFKRRGVRGAAELDRRGAELLAIRT
jgi:hypothetical protein